MKKQIVLPGIAFTETPRPTDAAVDTVDAEDRAEGASPQAEAIKETGQADGWPPMADMLHSLFVFEPTTPEPAPITVLGLGCGCARGPAALAPEQRALLEAADVLCGGRELLAAFEAQDGQSGLKARLLPLTLPLEPLLSRLSQMRAAGERVLLLADGDPLFFGIGATLVRQLGAEAVRLIPGGQLPAPGLRPPGPALAQGRLPPPWHGRDDLGPLNVAVAKDAPLCILTDARMTPDVLARHLLDRGVDWFTAHIFERMGAPDEARHQLSLAEAACRTFGPACTLLLIPGELPRRPHLGLDAEGAGRGRQADQQKAGTRRRRCPCCA